MSLPCSEEAVPQALHDIASFVSRLQANERDAARDRADAVAARDQAQAEVERLSGEVGRLQQEVGALQQLLEQAAEGARRQAQEVDRLGQELAAAGRAAEAAARVHGEQQQAAAQGARELGTSHDKLARQLALAQQEGREGAAEAARAQVSERQLRQSLAVLQQELEQERREKEEALQAQDSYRAQLKDLNGRQELRGKAAAEAQAREQLRQELATLQQQLEQERRDKEEALQGKDKYKKRFLDLNQHHQCYKNAYNRLKREKSGSGRARGSGRLTPEEDALSDPWPGSGSEREAELPVDVRPTGGSTRSASQQAGSTRLSLPQYAATAATDGEPQPSSTCTAAQVPSPGDPAAQDGASATKQPAGTQQQGEVQQEEQCPSPLAALPEPEAHCASPPCVPEVMAPPFEEQPPERPECDPLAVAQPAQQLQAASLPPVHRASNAAPTAGDETQPEPVRGLHHLPVSPPAAQAQRGQKRPAPMFDEPAEGGSARASLPQKLSLQQTQPMQPPQAKCRPPSFSTAAAGTGSRPCEAGPASQRPPSLLQPLHAPPSRHLPLRQPYAYEAPNYDDDVDVTQPEPARPLHQLAATPARQHRGQKQPPHLQQAQLRGEPVPLPATAAGPAGRQQLAVDVRAAPSWGSGGGRAEASGELPAAGGPAWKKAARPTSAEQRGFNVAEGLPPPGCWSVQAQPPRQQQQQQGAHSRPPQAPPAGPPQQQHWQGVGPPAGAAEGAGGGKGFKYQEVVRRRDERERLKGAECQQCQRFYEALQTWGTITADQIPGCGHVSDRDLVPANGGGVVSREELRQAGSRHRFRYVPPPTPNEFWNMDFTEDPPEEALH